MPLVCIKQHTYFYRLHAHCKIICYFKGHKRNILGSKRPTRKKIFISAKGTAGVSTCKQSTTYRYKMKNVFEKIITNKLLIRRLCRI